MVCNFLTLKMIYEKLKIGGGTDLISLSGSFDTAFRQHIDSLKMAHQNASLLIGRCA